MIKFPILGRFRSVCFLGGGVIIYMDGPMEVMIVWILDDLVLKLSPISMEN